MSLETNESSCPKEPVERVEIQGNARIKPDGEFVARLHHLLETCTDVHKQLGSSVHAPRDDFQQVAVNFRYFQSLLMEEIKRLNHTGVNNPQVHEQDQTRILEELYNLEKQVHDKDHHNIFHSMLSTKGIGLYNATSIFFVILPASLDAWNDLDPSSHQLRLHFLCENCTSNDDVALGTPQHVHFSNHPGYSLKRPQEFFHSFGDYVLRMLLMIKHGYSNHEYEIPPLDTFNILWQCSPDVLGNHITKNTIGPLINKAITYLQELSPPKWRTQLWLSRAQSAAVKTFLYVQEGDNAEANLHRHTRNDLTVTWRCQAHAHQYLDRKSLANLTEFVHSRGGHVNMQQETLTIDLTTQADADQLQVLVADTKHRFGYCIRLSWKATRSYVKQLFMNLGNKGSCILEIDGITPDNHPQGYEQYQNNLFHDILTETGIDLLALLNYPQPQQQTTLSWEFSVQSAVPPEPLLHRWMDLRSDIKQIRELVCDAQVASDFDIITNKLKVALQQHQVPGATAVTLYDYDWNAVFDLERGAIVEVYSEGDQCPKGLLSLGSLRTLGVHLSEWSVDQDFFRTVQANTGLQEFIVSHELSNILYRAEDFVRMWYESACSCRLLLLDRMQDTQGRTVAELALRGAGTSLIEKSTLNGQGCGPKSPLYCQKAPMSIEFLRWSCDEIGPPVSDYLVSFFDEATKQHPSTLTSFTLDISQLTTEGLSAAQNILHRSQLEHLQVVCSPFDHTLSLAILQVLDSVQWSTIKSLELSGPSMNEWMELWPCPFAPQLLSVQIQGTGLTLQVLSHKSVLFLYRVIHSSSMVELHLTDVELQESQDWVLLIESVNMY
ncbi:hypothetical protein BG004_003037 [Podila humilis]|nr:hypothetical protein BG004_003037 [Podila humilis]